MKCLAIVACLVAFAAAQQQQKTSFRGQKLQQWGQKDRYSQKQQSGQKDRYSQIQQWRQKQRGQKGDSQQQQKGKWTQQFYNKEHKCTVTKIPAEKQAQYESEFKALDVDNNGYLDSKEFKDEGAKISDAFSNFRKGKKPSWYNKGNKNGTTKATRTVITTKTAAEAAMVVETKMAAKTTNMAVALAALVVVVTKTAAEGVERGQCRNRRGHRQLADKGDGADFWKYLQQQGFVSQKPKQSTKDRMDSMRAAQVFRKFDQDHNSKVSLCEYENAMYRTEMIEKRMSAKKDTVVVHG